MRVVMLQDPSFERFCEKIDILNKTLVNHPEQKINLDKWIVLEDNGEQYQRAYLKALIEVYRDYNLDNEPLPGYKSYERLPDCNIFTRDSNQWFYWSYYNSIEDMRQHLMKNVERQMKEAEDQIKLVEEKRKTK